MSGDTEVHRTLGEHSADIANLQKTVDKISADVAAIKSAVDEGRGGWKVLMLMAGVSGTVGGAIGWFVSIMSHKPEGVP